MIDGKGRKIQMNIFLVEDEHWALAELVELFRRYETKHCIFPFSSGEEALAAADKYIPDLVLTDINMPGMDGLELIVALNEFHPGVKAIVLSVHDQFAYAQKGMKIGVIDYLLKPVRKDILFTTIDKTLHDISKDTKRETERIHGSITQQLLSSDAQENELSASIAGSKYFIAFFLVKDRSLERGWKDTPMGSFKSLFLKRLQERDIYCIDIDVKRKALLIPLEDESLIPFCKSCFAALYQQIIHYRIQVHMGYRIKKKDERLHSSFEALLKMLEEQMKFGISTFVTPDTRSVQAEIGGIWERVRLLHNFLKQGDIQKGKESIHKMILELRKKELTFKQLMLFVNDLFYSLKYNLQASSMTEISINTLHEDMNVLHELTTYDELSEWLASKVFELFSEQNPIDQNPKGLIPILINRIHSNYQHELSLQQFAADHHISLGYLSRLFKSQTGHTFSDYLIRQRIEKAKQLLSEGARITDVSSFVGYEDPKHFSYLFKKIVGEPPKTYAKRKKENTPP